MNNNNPNSHNTHFMFNSDGFYPQTPPEQNNNANAINQQNSSENIFHDSSMITDREGYNTADSTTDYENGSTCDDDNSSVHTGYTGYTESTTYTETLRSTYGILPMAIDMRSHYQGTLDMQKRMIAPFELSTKENEILLYNMENDDLERSIIEIWVITQVHDPQKRLVNSAWYNWVLLDLSRRLNQLDTRSNSHKLVQDLAIGISSRLFFDNRPENQTLENIPFYNYPLFSSRKRARLVRLANKFGDAICGLSEFIDFMFILKMTDVAFGVFYEDLQQSKWAFSNRIQMMEKIFTSSNPMGPFKPRIDPYNQGIEQFRFLHFGQ